MGHKPFSELTIADNYMFTRVMQDLEACRGLLEILLGVRIAQIRAPEGESSAAAWYGAKSVRLDVRTSDPEHEYDIEMQTADKGDLPLRARYYQSLMDVETVSAGTPYRRLRHSVVIFICLFDPFGRGEPVYTMRTACAEDAGVEYDDRAVKVFYNCRDCGKMADGERRALLEYIARGRAVSGYTRRLDSLVRRMRMTPREVLYYNNWLELHEAALAEGHEEGHAEGVQEGERNGAFATARRMLVWGKATAEEIAKCTALPLDEVLALQREAAGV